MILLYVAQADARDGGGDDGSQQCGGNGLLRPYAQHGFEDEKCGGERHVIHGRQTCTRGTRDDQPCVVFAQSETVDTDRGESGGHFARRNFAAERRTQPDSNDLQQGMADGFKKRKTGERIFNHGFDTRLRPAVAFEQPPPQADHYAATGHDHDTPRRTCLRYALSE